MIGLDWNLVLKADEKHVSMRASQTAAMLANTEDEQRHWYLDLEQQATAVFSGDSTFVIDLDDSTLASTCKTSVITLLKDLIHQSVGHATIARLAFSEEAGTVIRPDFLSYRLQGYEEICLLMSFLGPMSRVEAAAPAQAKNVKTGNDFLSLLETAVGGVIARAISPEDATQALRTRLDDELTKRLSIPWTVSQTLTRKRVFWVQGRANIEASQQFYKAAQALGIALVVLDEPGHWLEDDSGPYAHYREAFIPVSIAGDDGLTQRVVDAVRAYQYPVDGIVCISDVRLPLVAKACEILGLPTSLSAAYARAGNKGASREIESAAIGDEDGFVIQSVQDLDETLAQKGSKLSYPLIVKPCTGWNSDCVIKVRNEEELRAGVLRASERHAASAARSTGVVVEPYVDGPEVDANFIVLNGEVLFCDITDDFPCSGDLPGTERNNAANFMETLMDVPSALPNEEKTMMRNSLARSISRFGFQSGVFHCEARVRGSRAYYDLDATDGILDLHIRETAQAEAPSCFLHEINARPPGYINCVAALLAHGVDYYAVRLLLSLGSKEDARVRALSQPFLHGKPQYVLGISVLAPTRSGIMGSDDAVQDFLEANPDLTRHVVHFQTVKEKGDVVQGPDSSELWCVGYVIVASKQGRRDCLKLDREVRRRFDYNLVDD